MNTSMNLRGSDQDLRECGSCFRLLRALLATLALGLGLGACSTMQGAYPEAPKTVDASAMRYKIGPMDTLNVVVWRNPELSTVVTVRPDGFVTIPLAEDLQASGKSPSELSREIEKALSRLIRDPVVSIVVNGFHGVYGDQVRIVGEALRPQAVAYRKNMTLLDVMIQSGGLTDFANGNGAVLIRGAEEGKEYSLRLKDLLKRGDISANVAVMPGDIIIIPQSWF